jgi:zinc transport system permease protein
MRVFRSFRGVVICSAAVSLSAFLTGFVLAFRFDLPTGAAVVAVNAAAFIVFAVAGRLKKRFAA